MSTVTFIETFVISITTITIVVIIGAIVEIITVDITVVEDGEISRIYH
jgi:hypothetical protein